MRLPLVLTLALSLAGCAHSGLFGHGSSQLYAYHSGPQSLNTSAYYAVSSKGVVVFDAPMNEHDVLSLSQEIRINTSRPVEAVVVTSALPERFGGTGRLVSLSGGEIWATRSTQETIEASGAEQVKVISEEYGVQVPMVTLEPGRELPTGETVVIGGVRMKPIAAGAGPTTGMAAIYLPTEKALIAGGLVFDSVHPRVSGGRSDVWIATLEELSHLNLISVHPGNGRTGGPELIQGSILYLRELQAAITGLDPFEQPYSEAIESQVVESMTTRYPGWELEAALRASIEDEWLRQGGFPAAFSEEAPAMAEPVVPEGEALPGEAEEESMAPLFGLEPPDEAIKAPAE